MLYFSNKSSSFIKKHINLVCPSYLFYICPVFWKHYMSRFNFIIITQVTNKLFILFSSEEILLDIKTLSIYTASKKNRTFMVVKHIFVNFSITKTLRFLYPFLHATIKFMFYNLLLFSVSCINFMVSILLIPLTKQR